MSEQICDNCGATDAVMKLTTIVSNEMTTSHLCERCAAEKGLEATPEVANFPLTDFLAQMSVSRPEGPDDDTTACSFCGLTFTGFREAGRLGCPHCYETFEPHLRRLLRRIHGNTHHVGKVYLPPDPSASLMEKRLETLRRKLHRAIDTEDFETAAELRDQIRSMEPA